MVLLVGVHVQHVHPLVGFNGTFKEEDEKSTCPANLQIIGQQAGEGFVDQRLGDDLTGKARLEGICTKLDAELETIFTQLDG